MWQGEREGDEMPDVENLESHPLASLKPEANFQEDVCVRERVCVRGCVNSSQVSARVKLSVQGEKVHNLSHALCLRPSLHFGVFDRIKPLSIRLSPPPLRRDPSIF